MAPVLVFAPLPATAGRDDALRQTRWIADRTIEALRAEGIEVVAALDDSATRLGLETSAKAELAGIGVFAHGTRDPRRPATGCDAVVGADGQPALDASNLHVLGSRWAHAVACRLGEGLAAAAVKAGAECFAAYRSGLLVEWDAQDIPVEIEGAFTRLVVSTTMLLAQGERSEDRLRAAAQAHADEIGRWFNDHEDEPPYFFMFASQLAAVVLFTAERVVETR
jgi:hypothetical protein